MSLEQFGQLRKHQAQAITVAEKVAFGIHPRKVVTASVTPGGGKSLMASVFAHVLLREGHVDAVCVACPRDSLRQQMAESFTAPARGLNRRLSIDANRELEQGSLFSSCGYATTYQSITAAPMAHLRRFQRERFLLVLDEPHHLVQEDGASWVEALRPLVDQATTVLAMSGTLARHDRRPIPFVEYDDDRRAVVDIEYGRRDALVERAVLPLEHHFFDGKVGGRAGVGDGTCSLRTALDATGYRQELLRRALVDFTGYRATAYPSRALVVCHTQEAAREAAAQIVRETALHVVLAISDERDAQRALRDFRAGRGEVLVTVTMATEGFDAPDISHLICLSDIRSTPWLDQCMARATRVNPRCSVPWAEQRAYVFMPDDPAMTEYITRAVEEQEACLEEMGVNRPRASSCAPRTPPPDPQPLIGEVTHEAVCDEDGRRLADGDWSVVSRMRANYPFMRRVDPQILAAMAHDLVEDHMRKTGEHPVKRVSA